MDQQLTFLPVQNEVYFEFYEYFQRNFYPNQSIENKSIIFKYLEKFEKLLDIDKDIHYNACLTHLIAQFRIFSRNENCEEVNENF